MKTTQKLLMGILAAGTLSLAIPAQAVLFDQNVTANAIYGSGNANGGWTVDRSGGVELGLRAKVRFPTPLNQFNSNGDGTYDHLAGNNGAGQALWNFEWSINSDYLGTSGVKLSDLTYILKIDSDPTAAVNYLAFDPINVAFWDHSFGDNSTGAGAGVEAADAAGYNGLITTKNLAQNSWRMNFFQAFFIPANSFDPNVPGTYTFRLEASNGAATEMTVNAVPEPSTYLAGAMLLLPFGASAIRKLRKSRTA
ncbi:MAG: hypothetical protein ABL888_23415 [Pirellulaceae bacterium]